MPKANVFSELGVNPIINASGSTTARSGSRPRPEVMEAMSAAAETMVDIQELNDAAGSMIADYTGAEAGFVCSGSAGGLVLQAAACIAGSNPASMAKLPDTIDLANEIIIHKSHRFPYDQCYRAAGARFVEIGDGRRCHTWQLESAFTDQTVAVAYLFSPFVSRRAIPLDQVCEIAHARGVPVIVDAASFLPPRSNLRRFISQGADMVVYSGGKAVRGPQGTGILCGRKDLIDAAAHNASPNQFLGRSMKVSKEEIIGLVAGLKAFMNEDEHTETERYLQVVRPVVDALVEIPGLAATIEHDEYNYLIPTALIKFHAHWQGQPRDTVLDNMAKGTPHVFLHALGNPDELAVDPFNITEREVPVVIDRLRQELLVR